MLKVRSPVPHVKHVDIFPLAETKNASIDIIPTNGSYIASRMKPERADSHRRQHARLWQFSEVQKPRDLDLDRGSGQGHISMHNVCRTTSMPNHLTVASRTTEI